MAKISLISAGVLCQMCIPSLDMVYPLMAELRLVTLNIAPLLLWAPLLTEFMIREHVHVITESWEGGGRPSVTQQISLRSQTAEFPLTQLIVGVPRL